ncbi:hypothetical protein EMCRGX_G023234 [Ephydatia muelleri]
MKSILSYFVNCEDSSATQQLSDQNESANMPSPSSEAFTSDESRKETGEEVLKGVEAPECATKKKRLADDPIECKQRCCDDASGPFQTTDDTILPKLQLHIQMERMGDFRLLVLKLKIDLSQRVFQLGRDHNEAQLQKIRLNDTKHGEMYQEACSLAHSVDVNPSKP